MAKRTQLPTIVMGRSAVRVCRYPRGSWIVMAARSPCDQDQGRDIRTRLASKYLHLVRPSLRQDVC